MNDPMYRDEGVFKTWRDGKNSREYNLWHSMRSRCYKNDIHKNYAGYQGCTVAPAFHGFQAFAAWVTKQIGFSEGFQLDKDLLIKGNRVYAPERCIFLPLTVNSLLIQNRQIRGVLPIGVRYVKDQPNRPFMAHISRGQKNLHIGSYSTQEEAFNAYKVVKEEYIKEVAEKYRSVIDPRAYGALMSYQVEITD